MFKLTTDELESARFAIERHGYSALLPEPPEWVTVRDHWDSISSHLSDIDLDTYEPHTPLRIYAPKDQLHLRPLDLLHPEDLIVYTALVLLIKDDIEANRVSAKKRRVFSYRVDTNSSRTLYKSTAGSHESYMSALTVKSRKKTVTHVAIADIADFFPRIYQHRLANIVKAIATSDRAKCVSRVLVDKLISNLMDRNSYGIPVGPFASRVLAEAVLMDVDDHLISQGVDFVRWVDDYNFFTSSLTAAQGQIRDLGEWLFREHGLTLQSAKTKVLTSNEYRRRVLASPEDELTPKEELVEDFLSDIGDYVDEIEESDIEDMLEFVQSESLMSMLEAALFPGGAIDLRRTGLLLRRLTLLGGAPEDTHRQALALLLKHLEALSPIAEVVSKYILSLQFFGNDDMRTTGATLLKFLKSHGFDKHTYLAVWILHIFASNPNWATRSQLLRVYSETHSEAVKRSAALALARNGTRSEALTVTKRMEHAGPLHRLAILKASRLLGNDERKHWRRKQTLSGMLESLE